MSAERDTRDRERAARPQSGMWSPRLEPPSVPSSYTGNQVVLLVDECAETREILTHYLIRQGFIPMPVPDGAHAQVICPHRPHGSRVASLTRIAPASSVFALLSALGQG